MTEKDQNDPLAAERARAEIMDMVRGIDVLHTIDPTYDQGAESMAVRFANRHTITWERDVNDAGVPVRRYVARSAWEVDLATRSRSAEALRRVLDEIHRADEFGPHGAILRRDAEAIVRAVADSAGVVL